MNDVQKPTCFIIAGPNGAGKTTFAMRHLFELTGCRNFINADMISKGLSPLNPEKSQITGGKLFLKAIDDNINRRDDFSFETTFSGLGHVRLMKKLQEGGWHIVIFFLWIPTPDFSINRVRERVEHGGHNIPTDVILRRHPRIFHNLFKLYIPLCDMLYFYNNSNPRPKLIFEQDKSGLIIHNDAIYQTIMGEY